MNKQEKNKLVPALRFPEFKNAEEWEEKPLKKLAKPVINKNYSYSVDRVLTNSAADGIVDQRDFFDKDIANKNNLEGYYIVDYGDYVYNPRVSTIAPVGPISKNKVAKGVMSPLYTVFRFNDSKNEFFEQYFKTTHWHKYLRSVSNTGARYDRMSITPTIFMDMPLPYPKPIEQQKIADCLSSLDELIAAEGEKLDALKGHKKGLMQQLFPAEGQKVPALRFPGFKEEWEEKTLRNICDMQAGKFVSASDIYDGPKDDLYPCYGGNGLRGYTKSFTHNGQYPLIGRQGALCGNVLFAIGRFHATEHAVAATPKDRIDTKWLYYLLIFAHLNQYATGQAQPGLSVENLEKVIVKVPKSESEQQKIAECLSVVDELIMAQAERVEALKAHKRGLMQQLFPLPNE